MAIIDFPDAPSVNDEFTVNDRTWIWTGTTWDTVETATVTGPVGPPNVLTIGTVSSTGPDSDPVVTITGTSPSQTLNFILKQGPTGPQGSVSSPLDELGNVTITTPLDGEILTYDDTSSNWINLPAPISLPDQAGNSGYFLTTDGTNAEWRKTVGNEAYNANILNVVDPAVSSGIRALRSINLVDTSAAVKIARITDTTNSATLEFQTWDSTITTNTSYWDIYGGQGGLGFRNRFVDPAFNAIFIAQNGNVGIRTDSPQENVDIVGNTMISGSLFVESDNTEGSIILGDISSGTVTTDQGVSFLNETATIESGVFTEVDGEILSYGINVPQITTRDTTRMGGIFRLDTRSTYSQFVVLGYDVGEEAEKEIILAKLDTGDTYLAPVSGNVGVGTKTPGYKLEVNGSFAATTKSFVINHPTKKNKKLQYAAIEGPENGVYVRGTSTKSIIELPDYWTGLVHDDSITVNLTPIGKSQNLYVEKIENNKVYIGGDLTKTFYTIYAERKDVDKLVVEYDSQL